MNKLLFLTGILFSLNVSAHDVHWGYEGEGAPDHWGELEKQCGTGTQQSPVNIANTVVKKELPKIIFNESNSKTIDIVDNGHTLQVDFKEGSSITYDGKVYELLQFHAHEEAEHTIERVRYPLELHFVHKAKNGDVLVIGVLVKEGKTNQEFQKLKIFKSMAKQEKLETHISFNPEHIYPEDKSYYTYSGSLTTPPCSEKVTWIIFKTPITLTEEEIDDIKAHLPKNNNRPIRPLNGRVILSN
ncbi:carbonic anhydrase [Stenoxybacter acetivorans]|uniref:carbonic anhydrase n=1 Tax=Stenoxybacter acetivorans TaxID=422441 RepID=UPI0005619C8C|nr:carbonic anhydrase family protein [Stenoxybacter acetivorans]